MLRNRAAPCAMTDDLVIEAADSHNMVMAFTGMRLFHH